VKSASAAAMKRTFVMTGSLSGVAV
jgi:hypothetical protein